MPYVSIDELEHFEYHDAQVVSIELKDQCMKWVTKHINATQENTQNSLPFDRCVAEAEIVFESYEIKSILFAGSGTFDDNREYVQLVEPWEADPITYASILSGSLTNYCRIHGMHMEKAPADGKHKYAAVFTIDGGADIFDILLHFDRTVISWNAYHGKAWYEEDECRKRRGLQPVVYP